MATEAPQPGAAEQQPAQSAGAPHYQQPWIVRSLKFRVVLFLIGLSIALVVAIANVASTSIHSAQRRAQQRAPAGHAIVGSWDWRGQPFYTFNPDGSGTRDERDINWWINNDNLYICINHNLNGVCRSRGYCNSPRRWQYTLSENSLSLTHVSFPERTFNYTRTGYPTGPTGSLPPLSAEQVAQAFVGSWDTVTTGRGLDGFFVFNADGTGTRSGREIEWWVDERLLYYCRHVERCQGDCFGPDRMRHLLDGDTLILDALGSINIRTLSRGVPLGQTEGMAGNWYLYGEWLITLDEDGAGLLYGGYDINWWTRQGDLLFCDTPQYCRGNCPALSGWGYILDSHSLTLSGRDGVTAELTREPPTEAAAQQPPYTTEYTQAEETPDH